MHIFGPDVNKPLVCKHPCTNLVSLQLFCKCKFTHPTPSFSPLLDGSLWGSATGVERRTLAWQYGLDLSCNSPHLHFTTHIIITFHPIIICFPFLDLLCLFLHRSIFVSFGGLLMRLQGDPSTMQGAKVGTPLFLLMKKIAFWSSACLPTPVCLRVPSILILVSVLCVFATGRHMFHMEVCSCDCRVMQITCTALKWTHTSTSSWRN